MRRTQFQTVALMAVSRGNIRVLENKLRNERKNYRDLETQLLGIDRKGELKK